MQFFCLVKLPNRKKEDIKHMNSYIVQNVGLVIRESEYFYVQMYGNYERIWTGKRSYFSCQNTDCMLKFTILPLVFTG